MRFLIKKLGKKTYPEGEAGLEFIASWYRGDASGTVFSQIKRRRPEADEPLRKCCPGCVSPISAAINSCSILQIALQPDKVLI